MADSYTSLGTITQKWTRRPNWSREPSIAFPLARKIIGFPGTSGYLESESSIVPVNLEMQFTNQSKAEEYEILSFLCAKKGRFEKFWIPTWISAFTLSDAISVSQGAFRVNHVKFSSVYGGYERVRFLLANGDVIVRKVTAVEEIGTTKEELTVDTIFDRDIAIADVIMIDRFLLCRSDIDEFSMSHETDYISTLVLRVNELIREYP